MSEYRFEKEVLTIVDPEVGIDYQETFSPLSIPEELRNNLAMEGGHTLNIYKQSNGSFLYAIYLGELFDGEYQLTYPNGKIKQRCYYKEGSLHGPSHFYSEDGTLLTESWYIEGKQVGRANWYYHSGNKYSVQRYLDDKWHGKQEYWYEEGNLKTLMEYAEGEIDGKVQLYFPTGKLKRELTFSKGAFVSETSV